MHWLKISCLFALVFTACKKNNADGPDDSGIVPPKPYDSASLHYFVDGSAGSDANDGKTSAAAWKTIQKACDNATPGSLVMIKGGITYNEQVVVNVSGTQEHPIVFSGYGPDDPALDGTGLKGQVMLALTNVSNVSFQHLIVRNLVLNGAQGVAVTATSEGGCTHLGFHHLNISHIAWNTSATKTPSANDNAQPFIVYGKGSAESNAVSDLVIDSSLIENNIPGFSESLSLDGNIDGFVVADNLVRNNSNIGIAVIGNYRTSATASLDQARNGHILRNTCTANVAAYATSGGIYADGARDIVISRNNCSGNGYGVEVGCEENGAVSGITVAANLLSLNQVAGLAIGGYNSATTGQALNCAVYNNTFFRNNTNGDGSGELFISKASQCLIENNLFYVSGQQNLFTADKIQPQTGNTIDYNDWFAASGNAANGSVTWQGTVYATFDQFRQAQHQEAHGLLTDPLLTDAGASPPDLHLTANSPLRGKGNSVIVQTAAAEDFDGNALLPAGLAGIGAFR